jgi:hypothetical protein
VDQHPLLCRRPIGDRREEAGENIVEGADKAVGGELATLA